MGFAPVECPPPQGRALYLAEEQAKRPVADDRERACRWAGARREEVQLQQVGAGPETHLAVGIEVVQVVARDPVPAENQVKGTDFLNLFFLRKFEISREKSRKLKKKPK